MDRVVSQLLAEMDGLGAKGAGKGGGATGLFVMVTTKVQMLAHLLVHQCEC
jgi:hypothetical protein